MDMTQYFRNGLFDGQVVVVTGGASGIGLVVARGFAQLGAHVIVASRTESRLEAAVNKLHAEGCAAEYKILDVRDADAVERVAAEILAEHGRVDVLFNNAGGQFPALEEDLTPNGWRSVVDLNLNATFYCCSAFGRAMIDQGGGKIINMAISLVGRGSPGIAHRGAASAGIVNLTQSLAVAWSEFNVQVNSIGPQYLSPGAEANYGPALADYIASVTPAKRWAREHEIAGAVIFLASPLADYTSGMLLQVDGASALGPGVNYRESKVLRGQKRD